MTPAHGSMVDQAALDRRAKELTQKAMGLLNARGTQACPAHLRDPPAHHEAVDIAKWKVTESRKDPGPEQALVAGDRRGLDGEGGERHPLDGPLADA